MEAVNQYNLINKKFCSLEIESRIYGIPILDIREVIKVRKFVKVYHAKKEIRGLLNIRGQIHLVLSLRQLLGFEEKKYSEYTVIIFKSKIADSFGILVDKVGDIFDTGSHARSAQISETIENDEIYSRRKEFISDHINLDGQLIALLDPKGFLRIVDSN